METTTKTKRWGNSLGIVISKEVVEREGIKPNQKVTFQIRTKPITKGIDIFGKWQVKKPTEKLMREIDKEFNLGF